ncbi:PAAR-like domain-containing protein, partial [Sulfurimonas sp.]
MAEKFGARKSDKYILVSSAPSVNKTPMGPSVVPVPYPVTQELDLADAASKDVNFNSKGAFLKKSNSKQVKGDEPGTAKGVVSGTLSDKSEPILFSPSVKANGSNVIREDDLYKMQGGNTIGKLTSKDSGSGVSVDDNGAIEGDTLPPDLNLDDMMANM